MFGKVDVQRFFEHGLHHAFGYVQHIVARHKAHFHIDLRKFGLTVAARIFVAVTARYLKIAVKTRNH